MHRSSLETRGIRRDIFVAVTFSHARTTRQPVYSAVNVSDRLRDYVRDDSKVSALTTVVFEDILQGGVSSSGRARRSKKVCFCTDY